MSRLVIRLRNTAHWMHGVFGVCACASTAQCKMDATVLPVLLLWAQVLEILVENSAVKSYV